MRKFDDTGNTGRRAHHALRWIGWATLAAALASGCTTIPRDRRSLQPQRTLLEVRVRGPEGHLPAGEVFVRVNGRYTGRTQRGTCEVPVAGNQSLAVSLRSCTTGALVRVYPRFFLHKGRKHVLLATAHRRWWTDDGTLANALAFNGRTP